MHRLFLALARRSVRAACASGCSLAGTGGLRGWSAPRVEWRHTVAPWLGQWLPCCAGTPPAPPDGFSQQTGLHGARLETAAVASEATAGSRTGAARNASDLRSFSTAASLPPYSYTPPGRHHLFVPGPTNVPDRVMRAMARQSGAPRLEQVACS